MNGIRGRKEMVKNSMSYFLTAPNLNEILEDEWYLVRNSGETPEIALHSAIYFVTRAKNGPRATLTDEQFHRLREAAVQRFLEIVLRDLQHANSSTQEYRGIRRSIINFKRFGTFCERQRVDPCEVRRQAANALQVFLATELAEINCGKRPSIINCSYTELQLFAAELNVDLPDKFAGFEAFFLPAD